MSKDFVGKIKLFNDIAGTKEEFNQRKMALYTGLIFEELGEMIESFNDEEFNTVQKFLEDMSQLFKNGSYDMVYDEATGFDREAFLDASVDIAVVALGAGISVGADIEGACNEVADNNLTKFPLVNGEYTVLRDENGKVKKPENYKSVTLGKFLK